MLESKKENLLKSWLSEIPHNGSLKMTIAGAATGFAIVIVASTYAFTRPCVIGKCSEIPQARQLATEALSQVNVSSEEQEIFNAKQKLDEAITTLKTIPRWSNRHNEAQTLVKDYQNDSNSFKAIINASYSADRAISLVQNSSFEWEEMRSLWQNAIATLQPLLSDRQWRAIAQVKIYDYQKNLDSLQNREDAQNSANVKLERAKEIARVAKMRQNSAQTASDWKLVYSNWQTALQHLREISPQTSVYQETRQLIKIYTAELLLAGTRQRQEDSANNLYKRAIEQAKRAQNAENKQQWSAAAADWRIALTYIKQVSHQTFQYRQAEPLMATYALAFDRAMQYQQIEEILAKICDSSSNMCSYVIGDRAIEVKLTSTYTQTVWDTALQARANGNVQTQIDLLNLLSSLESTLQNLSNNLGKRVEVYNSDKRLITVYEPKT